MISRRHALAAVAILAPGTALAQVDPARAAADRLVAAMGGAEAWRRARGLRIAARHFESDEPEPYDNLILMALDEPRMRFEGRSGVMNRIRAVANGRGWRISEIRPVGPMTAEQVEADLRWWEAHAYRNIRRLALGDPDLTLRLAADGRLELLRPDGSQLMWYRLNRAGEPVAFGTEDNPQGSVLGPLEPRRGGVRLPVFATNTQGVFRALITDAEALPTIPQADYEKP